MSNEVKISSSTDDAAAVLSAAGQGAQLTEASDKEPQSEERRAEAERGEPDAQQQRDGRPRSAYQKRIDRLVKERSELRARLEKYERPGAMEERVFSEINQRRQAARQSNGNGNSTEQAIPEQRTVSSEGITRRESLTEMAARLERETAANNGQGQPRQEGRPDPQWVAEHQAKAAEFERRVASNPELQQEFQAAVAQARADGLKLDPIVFHGLVDLPNGEIVATYILENRDVFDSLHDLKSPEKKIAELHRISAGLDFYQRDRESQPAGRAPARTPPAPIRPVGGSSTKSSVPEEDMPYRQWADKRNAAGRERAKRGYSI